MTHAFTLLCMRTEQAAWYLAQLPQLDMAYIDGDHERAGVHIDLQLVANKIKPGGLLTAHDYDHEWLQGVRTAVDPYVAEGWEALGMSGSLGMWRRL